MSRPAPALLGKKKKKGKRINYRKKRKEEGRPARSSFPSNGPEKKEKEGKEEKIIRGL